MNTRERFLEVMNFNPNVPVPKWEFGLWGQTVNNWYEQGLPLKQYPRVPTEIRTPASSLYTYAWSDKCRGRARLPSGIAVMVGGLYSPTQGFPQDHDVTRHFGFDRPQTTVDVNLLFDPIFDIQLIAEDEQSMTYVDIDGVERVFMKAAATIPTSMRWPITDRASWEKIKTERLNVKDISTRFPKDWPQLVQQYRQRDYPLVLGGYPHGFFGTLCHLIGYENVFIWYATEPDLIHDILRTFTEIWLAVYEEVLNQVDVDVWHIWEDISFGKGSMISLAMAREFLNPYIKRIGDFLRARGVNVILLDTDGDCSQLIPVFMEAGVTGMYPFEVHCGMDVAKVRKQYPQLQMMGGISKSAIAGGKDAIDRLLKPIAEVLQTGGYIPFGDHFIPPDVSFENFSYYRTQLNRLIDRCGR